MLHFLCNTLIAYRQLFKLHKIGQIWPDKSRNIDPLGCCIFDRNSELNFVISVFLCQKVQNQGCYPLLMYQIKFRCTNPKNKIWRKLESKNGQNSVKCHSFFTLLLISQLSDVVASKFGCLRKGEIKGIPASTKPLLKNEYYKRYKPSRARRRRARDGKKLVLSARLRLQQFLRQNYIP